MGLISKRFWPYLAPKTSVFKPIAFSTKVYSSAGIVDRAGIYVSASANSHIYARRMELYLRPKNSANVVKVPYSASNLSNSGVRARTFIKAWKNPA